MNITVKQLRAFVAVAKTRSFTEGCALVHLSQPALSVAIKNLEEELGGSLLARTTRTLSLTPEGEAFYPTAQRLLADLDEAVDEMHNRFALFRGKVAIASMPSFASNQLPLALRDFRNKYPQINMMVHDVIAEDVVDMVRSGRVEVGVSFDPGDTEDLLFNPLFDDRFIAVLPEKHPLINQEVIQWQQLLQYDFIILQRPSSVRLLVDQMLEQEGLALSPQFETHQLATIGRMVATGLGVSVVPSLCFGQMTELGAVCRPLEAPVITRQVGVITRRRYPLSTAAKELVDVLLTTY
ncbi:LysR family transcriptional regulator, carnitine catabolism transcriptional activator [Neptunomonas antarctica]|uniref:LysR family transcriptional regulator, carnitine catabolism transcriptional activator n=1 Tax=Neptunomonas antarctica TaxID=619304 RepID=A0A1N7P1N5_9GAMM|nr:LysR family transcriptional regulator, carnitine catabolism transcriptional activator [Neptunomonas antarctica]